MDQQLLAEIESIGLKSVISILSAYAKNKIRNYKWSKGSNMLPKGYEISDFVTDTLLKALANTKTHKWNPSKGTALKFLQHFVLDELINNAYNSSENKKGSDIKIEDLKLYTLDYNPEDLMIQSELEALSMKRFESIQEEISKLVRSGDDLIELVFWDMVDNFNAMPKDIALSLDISVDDAKKYKKRIMRVIEKI